MLRGMVESQLDDEGEMYFVHDIDEDPTEDAYAFVVTNLQGAVRFTVEDEYG
jgi:hypothetical protein